MNSLVGAGLMATTLVAGWTLVGDPAPEPIRPELPSVEDQFYIAPELEAQPLGLFGKPFAPGGMSGCDEMEWYRKEFDLPAHFDLVGRRESSCRNGVTSSTGCCVGWWQIHELHVGTSYMNVCDIRSIRDIMGDDPYNKQRQACAAHQLYVVQGPSAWEATW